MSQELDLIGNLPPQALDVEKQVLGALIMDPKSKQEVMGMLTKETFYNTSHQIIYESILYRAKPTPT